MKPQTVVRLMIFFAAPLLMSGSLPHGSTSLQRELDALTNRGVTYRWLNEDLIELTDPVSGTKHLKALREPSEATIRAWAASRGVPILEIDPTQVDTNQYAGWYNYWTEVPLSNSLGNPLVVGDLDQNNNPEIYGLYFDWLTDWQSRVYEVDTNGTTRLAYSYAPLYGISREPSNVGFDSLKEMNFTVIGVLHNYEQNTAFSLPIRLNFQHNRYQGNVDPGHTGIFIGELDSDSLTDFLYMGSEQDSSDTTIGISKVYVAEFNADSNNFVRVWSTQFLPGQQSSTAGFGVEDFDRDGSMEFVASGGLDGRVFFAEKVGDNNYAQVWQDSTPYVNLYYLTSGDVDNDGWPEVFVAATMSNVTWVLTYEANSNNTYSLKFLFHLLSAGTFDFPTLLTSDINGDGKKELVIMSGVWLHVFKSNANDEFYLWYLKRENTKDAVQVYDFNRDSRQDFIISKLVFDSLGRPRFKADIYLASGLVSVPIKATRPSAIRLLQNYPNPFNPNTILSFDLPEPANVSLVVYDVLGRKIAELAEGSHGAGTHTAIWNAEQQASGVYFARFVVTSSSGEVKYSKVNKLVLMK